MLGLGLGLGLVTVVYDSGFLRFRVRLRPGFARLIYAFLGFWLFQGLKVFSVKGIY